MKYMIEKQTVLFYRRILRGYNVSHRSLLHQTESRLYAVIVVSI